MGFVLTDVEKSVLEKHPDSAGMKHTPSSNSLREGESRSVEDGKTASGWNQYVRHWIRWLGAEEQGIERIPEEGRTKMRAWEMFSIYYGGNCTSATLATGFLGTTAYGLGWWDSFMVIVVFNVVGAVLPTWLGLLGPRTGLRTMVATRYAFGWWFAKLLAILNIIQQVGWGVVNSIAGANILYDAGSGSLPLSVATLIICLCSVAIALFGHRAVTIFERASWIITTICLIVVAGFGGAHFINVPMATGPAATSSILSFGTVLVGYEVAWAPVVSDYGCYMESNTSRRSIWTWTYAGMICSQILVEALGAALGTLPANANPMFAAAYESGDVGGLIGACFANHGSAAVGFGKFIEVLLALSVVAVIIFGIYSIGLSAQIVSSKAIHVPRLVWTFVGGAVIIACAVAGRNHLTVVMTNFLSSCAYWLTPFCSIMIFEMLLFRRGSEPYNLLAWNDRKKLPVGIAAGTSFILGTVVAVLSMSTGWWVGPIAVAAGSGPGGADISWQLALGVTAVLYPPMRYWELKRWAL